MKALIITHKGDYNKNDFLCSCIASYRLRNYETYLIRTNRSYNEFLKDYELIYVVDREKEIDKDNVKFFKDWTEFYKELDLKNLFFIDLALMYYLSQYDFMGIIKLGLLPQSDIKLAKLYDISKLDIFFHLLAKLLNFDREEEFIKTDNYALIGQFFDEIINERLKNEKLLAKGSYLVIDGVKFFITDSEFPYPELILSREVDIVITRTKNRIRVVINSLYIYVDIEDFKESFKDIKPELVFDYVAYFSKDIDLDKLIRNLANHFSKRVPQEGYEI